MIKHDTYANLKILIVDKSISYAQNLKGQLKLTSLQHSALPKFEVKVASCGQDALLISDEFWADCVLVNYELSDMKGVDFLDLLAEVRRGISGPFLLLVEPDDETAMANLIKQDIDEFLVKDEFDALQLTWTIHCMLEKAKSQAQLYRKHEDLKIFADRMAHDLLVSLSKLSLYTEYLEMNTEAETVRNTEQQYALSAIFESIDQTIGLVESLRDYAYVDCTNINFSKVNLNSIMDHILLELKPEIDAVGAQILVEPLPIVIGDPLGLGRLLQTLIISAIKQSNETFLIHVKAIRFDTTWQISVTRESLTSGAYNEYLGKKETRIEETMIEVEDAFGMHRNGSQNRRGANLNTKRNSSSRGKDPGAEIKLAICRKIVEFHGGTIEYRSLLNGGTVCYFTIEQNLKTSHRQEHKDAFNDIALSNHHPSIFTAEMRGLVDV